MLAAGAATIVVLGIGIFGTLYNRSRIDDGLRNINPADRELYLDMGYAEANRPIQVAGVVAGAFALGIAIGQLRRR